MLIELRDYLSGDTCGLVKVINFVEGKAKCLRNPVAL